MGCVSFTEQFLDKGARNYEGDCDSRYYVFSGDIVLATRQQSDNLPILGLPAIIPQKYESSKLIVGANLYKVENHNKDFPNSYLYWLLKSPQYIRHIRSCQTGTTVRMITKSNIEDYHFLAPSKSRRNEIARFLWNIENKIELNRKINSNLEEQAKALFKSWFIDFEPFKDGKFVDSELGKIPEGWKMVQFETFISECQDKVKVGTYPAYSVTNNGITPRIEKFKKQRKRLGITVFQPRLKVCTFARTNYFEYGKQRQVQEYP